MANDEVLRRSDDFNTLERIDEDGGEGTMEFFQKMDQQKAFPVFFLSRVYGPRSFTIWLNNTLVVTWYALVYGGFLGRGLATRFGTLWLISSSNNLVGEHLSEYGTWKSLDFVRDFILNAIPFLLGIVMVLLPNASVLILGYMFTVSCLAYVANVYLRYYLAEHKTHRYSLYLEVAVHTILPPALGQAIFDPEDTDFELLWLACIGCDVVLKLGRTIFVYQWEEPNWKRAASWAKGVSNESFLEAFTNWDGGATERVSKN